MKHMKVEKAPEIIKYYNFHYRQSLTQLEKKKPSANDIIPLRHYKIHFIPLDTPKVAKKTKKDRSETS